MASYRRVARSSGRRPSLAQLMVSLAPVAARARFVSSSTSLIRLAGSPPYREAYGADRRARSADISFGSGAPPHVRERVDGRSGPRCACFVRLSLNSVSQVRKAAMA